MRKYRFGTGTSLIEMLVIIPILIVIMVICNTLFRTSLRDVPAGRTAVQTDGQIHNVLRAIQRDMDRGIALPETAGDFAADEQTLLIQTSDGVICYEFDRYGVTRTTPAAANSSSQKWQMKNAVISVARRPETGPAKAIEIHTGVTMPGQDWPAEHLVNNHVYFLDALHARQVTK
ncbi:MAG: hypothetical protein EHM48_04785 [Planctomycetaceae bacterium]|nr:MAG: hypothetical protein EHM48_04785 [Planctomycetaceae bacterium]